MILNVFSFQWAKLSNFVFLSSEEYIVLTIKKMLVVASLVMLPVVSFAQSKVVSINPQMAVFATTAAKAKIDQLQKKSEFVESKAKLDGIAADIKTLQASYQKDGPTWSAEKKAESEKKLQSLSQDYQFQGKKLQAQQQEVMQVIMQEMSPKLEAAIKQIVQAEGITMVVDSQAVIIAKPESDYTAKLTDALNKAK